MSVHTSSPLTTQVLTTKCHASIHGISRKEIEENFHHTRIMAFAATLAENSYFPTASLIESDGPIDTQYFFDLAWQDLPEYLISWHWISSSNQSFPTNSSSSQASSLPNPASEHYFHGEIAGGLMDEPSFVTTQLSPASSKNQQSACCLLQRPSGERFPTPIRNSEA
ncbi:hypothetical protein QL093DRAFT_1444472 [Fusarium oxysporum]|nr:hypothetical protein QL093DRAFT_1444472 [Fusarium oxysporum]